MAGPTDTRQQIATYIFIQFLPIIIVMLLFLAYSTMNLAKTTSKMAPLHLWGNTHVVYCKRVKKYKKFVREHQNKDKTTNQKLHMYLFQAIFDAFKVVVASNFFFGVSCVSPIWDPCFLALQSATAHQAVPPPVKFDSDLYPIGVDNHASKCMANVPHLFEDICLTSNKG
jgi:hypothetical protein